MKLYIIRYNDSCGCHAEFRSVIIFANSKKDARKMAPSRALEEKRFCDIYEYPIEEGLVDGF